MSNILTLAMHTFLLLRRDKIFLPAAISGILFTSLANLASNWTIEEFTKVLFDIGSFGFHFTGALVGIFWGAKLFQDAKSEGSVEVQLAGPITRSQWIIGNVLGLTIALSFLGLLLLVIWQAFMFFNQFGLMTLDQLIAFIFLWILWLVLASAAIFFATFSSYGVAIFATVCLWLIGLASSLIASALPEKLSIISRSIIIGVAWLWDLQRFIIIDEVINPAVNLDQGLLLSHASYGGLLFLILITMSCFTFSKRDIIGN